MPSTQDFFDKAEHCLAHLEEEHEPQNVWRGVYWMIRGVGCSVLCCGLELRKIRRVLEKAKALKP